MRKILVVGAGQAGLQLALGLQANGYDVTVMSARTPAEIRGGWPTSTQVLMHPALDRERDAGLNFWEDQATPIGGMDFTLSPAPGVAAYGFSGAWAAPGNSVDQRVKMAAWLELFEQRGGRVIYHPVAGSDLAGLAPLYDLTVIAAGNSELARIFPRDPVRSPYTRPARHLAAIYLHGVAWPAGQARRMRVNLRPGGGEVFAMPALGLAGPCDVVLVEAVPGGPLDVFTDRPSPAEHLRRLRGLLAEQFPWEDRGFAAAEPVGARPSLTGAFPSTVRQPCVEVAPGQWVLGLGDVVVVNDPIAGQGANNAVQAADLYLNAVLDRGGAPFTPQWMRQVFGAYWAQARHSVRLTELLLEPLPPHAQQVLGAASHFQEIADRVAEAFPAPATVDDFLTDPGRAAAYVESVAAAHREPRAVGGTPGVARRPASA